MIFSFFKLCSHFRYLTEVGSTEQLLNARTARLQIMQSLANSDMMPTFHKAPVTDQSTSPGPDDRLIDRTRNNNQGKRHQQGSVSLNIFNQSRRQLLK